MARKQPVNTDKALQSPLLSQAIVHNNTIYVSGSIGFDASTGKVVEGTCEDRSVRQA